MIRALLWCIAITSVAGQAFFPPANVFAPQYCLPTALLYLDASIGSNAGTWQDQSPLSRFRVYRAVGSAGGVQQASSYVGLQSDGYIELTNTVYAVSPSNALTFAAWVQPTNCGTASVGSTRHILNVGTMASYFFVSVDSSCRLTVGFGSANSSTLAKVETRGFLATPVLSTTSWNYVAVTVVNGVVRAAVTTGATPQMQPVTLATGNFTLTPSSYAYTSAPLATRAMPDMLGTSNFIGKSQFTYHLAA